MIRPGSSLRIARIPLQQLHVWEHQQRYRARLDHYLDLLEQDSTGDPGVIHVKPRGDGYEVLDGHHRFCALVMSGRTDALCLVIEEPA